MGELSRPIKTPLGVVYRNLFESEESALKASQWAVKVFGGKASSFDVDGPGKGGFYQAAIIAKVPEGVKWISKQREGEDTSWMATGERAFVLFDADEAPAALYFAKHELIFKVDPPMIAHHTLSMT